MVLIENFIGIVAGFLGISGLTYQMIRKSAGMTYPNILLIGTASFLWMSYGITLGNSVIYVTNIILVFLLVIITIRKYCEVEKF